MNVKIFGEQIPHVDQAKYLGVYLDFKLTFKHHITKKVESATRAKKALYPLIGRRSHLSLENKLTLYKQILQPQILYASEVFSGAAKCHIERLQVYQNSCLRLITNSPWFVTNELIHNDLKIPAIWETIRKNATKFLIRNRDRPCLEDIENYDPSGKSLWRHRPRRVLIDNSQTFPKRNRRRGRPPRNRVLTY